MQQLLRLITFIALLFWLTGCGNNTNKPEPPTGKGEITQPIGAEGGVLETKGEDDTSFSLSIPANALSEAVDITLTPLSAEDNEYVRFRLSPAELKLEKPATLSVTLPEGVTPEEGSRLYFGSLSSDLSALPTTVNTVTHTLNAEVTQLGTTASAALSPLQNNGNGGGAPLDVVCQQQVNLMNAALSDLYASSGTLFSAAELVIGLYGDVLLNCQGNQAAVDFLTNQTPPLQTAYDNAVTNLDVLLVNDFNIFVDALPPIFTYGALLAFVAPDGYYIPIDVFNDKFAQLSLFLEDKYETSNFESDFWRVENEIVKLLEIWAAATQLTTEDFNEGEFYSHLLDLIKAYRQAAYSYCLETKVQYPLWRQLRFEGFIDGINTAQNDIEYCGSNLSIDVVTHLNRKVDSESKTFDFTSLDGGAAIASAKSPVEGSIVLSGDVLPLRCSRVLGAEGFGTDKLELRLNEVVLKTLNHQGGMFLNEPVTLDLKESLEAADIDPLEPPEEIKFEVWRMDGKATCTDVDNNPDPIFVTADFKSKMFEITYSFDPAPILESVSVSPDSIEADSLTLHTFSLTYKDLGKNLKKIRNTFSLGSQSGSDDVGVDVPDLTSGFGEESGTGTYEIFIELDCSRKPDNPIKEEFTLIDEFDQESERDMVTIAVDYSSCEEAIP